MKSSVMDLARRAGISPTTARLYLRGVPVSSQTLEAIQAAPPPPQERAEDVRAALASLGPAEGASRARVSLSTVLRFQAGLPVRDVTLRKLVEALCS